LDHVSYQARVRQQREPRYGADVDASLLWEGVSQPVTIRNISVYGALIIGAWLPAVGQRVTLIAQGLEVCGTVIWEGPDRCGLLLSRAVDPLAIIAESGMVKDDRPTITLQRVGTDRYA
jgi:hypothetical protein